MTLNPRVNASLLSQIVSPQNFVPQLSASLAVAGTSASVTFAPLTGQARQSFKITNKGTHGAYIAWGAGSATAVASSGTPAAYCDYIAAGVVILQDFEISTGIVDTLAAIQDGGTTTLEISVGFGQ